MSKINETIAAIKAEYEQKLAEKETENAILRGEKKLEEEKARKAKIAAIWDKVTTGLLIALMASPFLILVFLSVRNLKCLDFKDKARK